MNSKKLDRRASLKVFGVLAGAAALAPLVAGYPTWTALAQEAVGDSARAELNGMLYWVGKEGYILKSKDRGNTWEVSISLGADCQASHLYVSQNTVYAEVLFQGLPFSINSQDGNIWHTTPINDWGERS